MSCNYGCSHRVSLSTTGSTVLFDDTVTKVVSLYPQLTVEVGVRDCKKWGIIHGGIRIEPNSQTPVHNPRAVISSGGNSLVTFKFEAMLLPQVSGHLPEDNERFLEVLQTLLPGSGYFLCQGLPSEVTSLMTYDTKNARRWGLPFGRIDHQECPLWVKEASSSTSPHGQPQRCEKCANLMYYVRRQEKKRKLMTPEQMAKRVLPSSHCPVKYLSPASAETRRRNIAQEKKARKRKVNFGSGIQVYLLKVFVVRVESLIEWV